jgi:hypothetical protein
MVTSDEGHVVSQWSMRRTIPLLAMQNGQQWTTHLNRFNVQKKIPIFNPVVDLLTIFRIDILTGVCDAVLSTFFAVHRPSE